MEDNLKNNELSALISLLDEPDDEIFNQVRERLFSYGNSAIPLLEDAWDTSYSNNDVQHRIESIIHDIQFDAVFKDLSKWRNTPEHQLMAGFMT
ncbi:MAG: hypothetical protein EOM23_08070, partial [Candidatus Moranbacteria bacterium]|nr:hypothetical protein [Candidatus Moranbacteria bacterium]